MSPAGVRCRGDVAFLVAAGLCATLLQTAPARAATVTVTGTGDTIAVDGLVTLREAITSINGGASVNADVVASGSYGSADTIAFAIALPPSADGVHTILITSALPALTRTATIDGETQTLIVGDSNPGTAGTGGVVGATGVTLLAVNRPEIEIAGTSGVAVGLAIAANDVVVRSVAVYGFGSVNIDVQQNSNAVLIEHCLVGSSAAAFVDPGPGFRPSIANILVGGGTNNGIIRRNLIGFGGGDGLDLSAGGATYQILENEIRGNGQAATGAGIDLAGSNTPNQTVRGNLIVANSGFGIDLFVSNGNATIEDNTITANGRSGIGIGVSNNRVTRNVLSLNGGSGVLVGQSASGNPISQNAIFDNGAIGIDLLSAGDDQALGTAPFVTINDQYDGDGGGNGLLNAPILVAAAIDQGALEVTGFAGPGAVIELFIADPDSSGFGEGRTYLFTRGEQSGDDLDGTSGSYGPGAINGLIQGSDTTNRFRFVVPLASLPASVTGGTILTATATSANATSEFSGTVAVTGGATLTLSGTVFEDVAYGGGPGRSAADSGGLGRPGVIVELYDANGAYLATTTTDAGGGYAFSGLSVDATHFVRVVNASITSSRPGGSTPGLLPVQTYRADLWPTPATPAGQVGGTAPSAQDSGAKGGGGDLDDPAVEQSVTRVVPPSGATTVSGIDFGFNFDTVVNANDAGQGSLRQFVLHANVLENTGLDQSDTVAPIPAGVEAAVFMIPGTGVHTIGLTSPLPPLTDGATWIDGSRQAGAVPSAPTIELSGASAPGANGFVLTGGSASLVRGIAINGFSGSGIVVDGGTGHRVAANRIGTDVTGSLARPNGTGISVANGATDVLVGGDPAEGNVVAFNGRGVVVGSSVADAASQIRLLGNSLFGNTGLGIDLGLDGVTQNDPGDGDTGPNGLANVPVLTRATIQSGLLVLEGLARPGSSIELFVADPDTSGFGEGRTPIATVVEGAADDLDGSTSSYGPLVGGITVGSDTTTRFRFELALSSLPVAIASGTALTATATIGGATSEFGPTIAAELPADLSVAIQAQTSVQPGDPLVYTVTVTNNGPGTATGVAIHVTTPPALAFQSTSGTCTTSLPCGFASLAAGETRTFSATFAVPPDYRGPTPVVGTATVSGTTLDLVAANDAATTSTHLPSADLAITETVLVGHTAATGTLTIRIHVRNLGPDAAANVVLSDAIPQGVAFTANAGACVTTFPCALGTLAPGAERIVEASYAVPLALAAPIAHTATVTSTTPDPDPANGSVTAVASRRSGLSVTKTGPTTVSPGQSITYSIVVSNDGPDLVSLVTVEDPTPAALAFVSASGACETAFPCRIGSLAAGRQAAIVATYRAADTLANVGAIANTVTVSSPTPDTDLADNVATVSSIVEPTPDDGDGDGMPDGEETCYGLDTSRDDGNEDPDGDGRTNREELAGRTHPRGFAMYHLPEGADNGFFKTRLSLVNPDAAATARLMLRLQPEGASEVGACFPLPPLGATVIDPAVPTALRARAGLGASFASVVESDLPLVAERTTNWAGGGEHADTVSDPPGRTWYFAEGATHDGFRLYYLLQNPGLDPATIEMTFIRSRGRTPVVRRYALAPRSRFTIFANVVPELADTDLAAIVRVVDGGPITAGRSMYRDAAGQLLRAGISSSGAAASSTDWYFAEGAVGDFFAEYVLVLNPDPVAASLELSFLPAAGTAPVTARVTVPAASRTTFSPLELGVPRGASTALQVRSTNGVPVVVERSMWWPNVPAAQAFWTEGHLSTGASQTAPRWLFAGQTRDAATDMYLLIGNFGSTGGQVRVTATLDDGRTAARTVEVAPRSRTTLAVDALVPDDAYGSVRLEIASLDAPLPLVVERAVYRTRDGVAWSSGSVTMGAPRP